MKRPAVTPIFPKHNNASAIIPDNLPIRTFDSRQHILNSGGFSPSSPNHYQYHLHPPDLWFQSPGSEGRIINCVDIAHHIDTCPICSRLYDTDKTLYMLAIIALLILCFLLVKRIIKL